VQRIARVPASSSPLSFRKLPTRATARTDPMTLSHRHRVHVEFGDCDPAQIVHFPNYFRWMDAASRHYFVAAGVPPWNEVEDAPGLVGTPVVDASARFLRPASYGDDLAIETTVAEWRRTSFVMSHIIRRGGETLVEGREVRVFAARTGPDPRQIRSIPCPASVRRLVDATGPGAEPAAG
jgi:4-hydroxybenzoyl-CoA thioesterase